MIEVYVCSIERQLSPALWAQYFNQLPYAQQKVNARYARWQDKHAHLFGKLLLKIGLMKLGYNDKVLYSIQTTGFKKPYIDQETHFNISHAGKYVVCAVNIDSEIGIDIEHNVLKEEEIVNFEGFFSAPEWDIISSSGNKIENFYRIWTRKESVIKADGRGLYLPPNKFCVTQDVVWVEGKKWFVRSLSFFDRDYSLAITVNNYKLPFTISVINFY